MPVRDIGVVMFSHLIEADAGHLAESDLTILRIFFWGHAFPMLIQSSGSPDPAGLASQTPRTVTRVLGKCYERVTVTLLVSTVTLLGRGLRIRTWLITDFRGSCFQNIPIRLLCTRILT